ncbi:mitochondrial 37S ribosomal protein mS33 Ecym_2087 [Eremothecium cymbalariae DBVPG|uniref:Small ribosomal subunit protein mS33 n=1 Tax=Eremothecium cymbalariae (strain CBS 270.75 / DBVPG 7215 / KCTC 17166 / NRRL Y-17582) TaxID=931890 RepID=G8JPJ1_ERECY|nr:Hypothetical protein Ecym_2087 [Eremothecium cymbalariae DBVPG\
MVSKDKLLRLSELSAKIFDQNFNPSGVRTGAKILSKRLKGPAIANYYPNPDFIKFKQLKSLYPGFTFTDEEEAYRTSMVELRKRRGKGAPAKKKGPSTDKKKK